MREYKGIERRKYIRLKSVFPVEFKLLSLDGKSALSDLQQGFTADVSKGGILLRVNNIKPEVSDLLGKREAKLLLDINIPLRGKAIEAMSCVAWMTVLKEGERESCLIGLSFDEISNYDRRKLVGYTSSLYRTPKLMAVALSLMLVALGVDRAEEVNLRRENAILIERLTDVLQKKDMVVEWLNKADKEKGALLMELEKQNKNVKKLEGEWEELLRKEGEWKATVKDLEELKEKLNRSRNIQAALESQMARVSEDRKKLQKELDDITRREKVRRGVLERIEKARVSLEKATVDNMYNWLQVHRNRRTGLIASYEGDETIKNTAFIYDQSLVAQVFLLNDDIKGAKSILDFFKDKAKRHQGAFANAYGVNNGAITEYTVHCGPNIWLGIALMQYMEKTGGEEYLNLATEIGDWIVKVQDQDPGGGIKGGPDVSWFSTEHNLDAYAFFTMLAEKTNSYKYRKAAEKSLRWIKYNAYTGREGRIYRGKGDSTIATDTFSWAIAAIGPKVLMEVGMDPDAIMKFAEDNCKVTVDFVRPDGKVVKVTGFDFAKRKNLARGGVISSEWTAQMIVSLEMMSDFYLGIGNYQKSKFYQDKHDFYMSELEKLIITSPSRSGQGAGCLPYATQENVDTGHGWRTPRGEDTGSVSGTAYGIFAIKSYNPLKLASSKK